MAWNPEWTHEMTMALCKAVESGMTLRECSEAVGKSYGATRRKIASLGISVQQHGNCAGVVRSVSVLRISHLNERISIMRKLKREMAECGNVGELDSEHMNEFERRCEKTGHQFSSGTKGMT